MSKIIFRNDDVTLNTDFLKLDEMYHTIYSECPDAEIWSCVTVFSKNNDMGSVYPDPPFKSRSMEFFYDVNRACDNYFAPMNSRVVSHGLWHINHAQVGYELQEASIVTSCKVLDTDVFVPPFNAWNKDTELICIRHGIALIKSASDGWKSLEHNDFDKEHKRWYLHSWRYTPQTLEAALRGNR